MKKWIIKIPIYNYEVEVLYDGDMQSLVNYVSESNFISPSYHGNLDDYDALTWNVSNKSIITTITMDEFVLLHECVHVVQDLSCCCGIDDDEFFAYTLQYLYKQLMQEIND